MQATCTGNWSLTKRRLNREISDASKVAINFFTTTVSKSSLAELEQYEMEKPICTIVLDAGPIIKNEPSVSTLLSKAEKLVTTPAVISEIKDSATRSRVETILSPFLELRSPNAASVAFVQEFARKTGDLAVLSRTDIQIIALAYELECEQNGGDWRLRKTPGQKRINGPAPPKPAPGQDQEQPHTDSVSQSVSESIQQPASEPTQQPVLESSSQLVSESVNQLVSGPAESSRVEPDEKALVDQNECQDEPSSTETQRMDEPETSTDLSTNIAEMPLSSGEQIPTNDTTSTDAEPEEHVNESSSSHEESADSDSEGWITPSNIKRQQAKDSSQGSAKNAQPINMSVATITTDFAMQNVLLQVGLNLISTSLQRISHLKTFVLRCHACFQTTKDMSKQFCPRCGQPALTRVSCSTSANGEFKLHLKKNMQWNTRGNRYAVPKPVSGTANGRVKGGGKGGWGNDLVLSEDQKEYVRAVAKDNRQRERDLMNDDFLPSILSGRRDDRPGGRPKIGAGRNINSKKR